MNKRASRYTYDTLTDAVNNSLSMADVLRYFGLSQSGGNHQAMSQRLSNLGISTEHFKGYAWNKGLTASDNSSVLKYTTKNSYKTEDILVENSPQTKTSTLRRLMVESGVAYICDNNHEPIWMGEPLTLHIDHINGFRTDNRLCNLRFLCPNCHQQTETWGRRKSE